jgi:hypothetical protein
MSREKKTYISGIYNYCDRWCEKCRFTSNCYLYTTESRISSHQILNNGEMPPMEEVFKKEDFQDDENDFNEKDYEEPFFEDEDPFAEDEDDSTEFEQEDYKEYIDRKRRRSEQSKTPLEEYTKEYLDKAHRFVKLLDEKFNLSGTSKDRLDDASFKRLYDNFDIFCYYHMFIHVKFQRALHGKEDILEDDDDEMKEIHAYDMNGTAKIATISVNNSVEALNELYILLPALSSDVEELLVLLGKIKNESEKEFPDCMKFKRPGFDD